MGFGAPRDLMSCLLHISDRHRACPCVSLRRAGALLCCAIVTLLGGGTGFPQDGKETPADTEPPAGEKPLTPEEAAAEAAEEAKAAEELRKAQEEALEELLGDDSSGRTPEQVAHLKKWIPHTYGRLAKREEVHIAAIGDSVTRYISYDGNLENSHYAFHGIFAAKLCDEFFYTGGVRDINPTLGNEPKLKPLFGPELTLENIGMNGRFSLHALARLTTDALLNQPDLVLFNFGINDALLNEGLQIYVEALDRSVRYVQSTGADVILLGPSHMQREPTLKELARTRKYSGAMEELAAKLDVFYFDLSDVTMRAPGTPPEATPEEALAQIAASYQSATFDHGPGNEDFLHPAPGAHRKMGLALFDALMNGRRQQPYRVGGFFTLGEGGTADLEFKLKNLQDTPAKGQILLMPVAQMKPDTKALRFDLAPGKGKVFHVNYATPGGQPFILPANAPRAFASMIITDAQLSYSPVFPAPLAPIGVAWDTGSQDLSSSTFLVHCDVFAAPSIPAASGTYRATWNEQTVTGRFGVQPGEREPLDLKFRVPTSGNLFTIRDHLILTLEIGGKELRFDRVVEASRNIGLGESIPLLVPEEYMRGERKGTSRVEFVAEATPQELVLNFDVDIAKMPLEGGGDITPLVAEFQLDARRYGKRRKFGFVDFVRVRFRLDGTVEKVSALRPAVFGDWYSRALDNSHIKGGRTMLPDGRARYFVKVPRSYLYKHEFAIGNGNSKLGINAELQFAKGGDPDNPYPQNRRFKLVHSRINRHSAESLGVLELVPEPTGRWSVRVD